MDRDRIQARQLLGSILVALTIVAGVVVIVVATLGTGTGENRNDDSGGGKDKIERSQDDDGG
jgi:hypothetical protein